MKLLTLFFLVFTNLLFSQSDTTSHRFNRTGGQLYFFNNSNNIIAICYKEKFQHPSIKIWSFENQDVLYNIILENRRHSVFNISHDDSSFVVFQIFKNESNEFKSALKKYNISKKKWIWEVEWFNEYPCLRLVYNEDNSEIICITEENVRIVNAYLGGLISESDEMSSELGLNYLSRSKLDISKTGKYFVFWQGYYSSHELSPISEYGANCCGYSMQFLATLLRYTLFFWIPEKLNFLYVWDVKADSLLFKQETPKGSTAGVPVFSEDEKLLLFGELENKYYLYALPSLRLMKEMDIIFKSDVGNYSRYKVISPNNKIFASIEPQTLSIRNLMDGEIIKNFEISGQAYRSHQIYEMAFSSDSKYFIFEDRGIIKIYDTNNWQEEWWIYTYPEDTQLW